MDTERAEQSTAAWRLGLQEDKPPQEVHRFEACCLEPFPTSVFASNEAYCLKGESSFALRIDVLAEETVLEVPRG